MVNHYDVIVIGAGNAGLATAATTAQKGLKTLVIERNILPGGCATSFTRGRFEFESSLHELANVGTEQNPGSVRQFFESLGADVTCVNEENAFRVIAGGEDGYDATMPAGIAEFCDEIWFSFHNHSCDWVGGASFVWYRTCSAGSGAGIYRQSSADVGSVIRRFFCSRE